MADVWRGWVNLWWLPVVAAPFVGSLLGVLIERLPAGEPVVFDRSRCRSCGATLAPRDLIPLVSFALTRGRCRICGAPIGWFAPAIEAAAVLTALWAAAVVPMAWLWPTAALGWVLLALAVIDARHLILPDPLTLPLIPAGLIVVVGVASPDRFPDHLIGAAVGLAASAAVRVLYRRLRGREGLGLGDVKLLAAAGAWVGWQGLPWLLLVAAATALAVVLTVALVRRRLDAQAPIPFGPFLCLGFWLVWLYGAPAFG
ncbi:MAG: A24 family peptidase [Rhodospirillales bacterium]